MKSPLYYFKNSLSTKLSLWIVLFTAVVLVSALGYMFSVSRQAIRQEAVNHATEILENTTLRAAQRSSSEGVISRKVPCLRLYPGIVKTIF